MIKSVRKDCDKTSAIEYPCIQIGADPGVIVLFSGPKKGMALNNADLYIIGQYSETWQMDNFKPYNGTIELSSV